MMRRVLGLALFLMLGSFVSFGQNENIRVSGEIYDTLNKRGVEHAVVMAIRVSDSVLQNYTRTNWKGEFDLDLPIDTFQILFNHPKFEEREYYVFGNSQTKDLDFGRIVLPERGEHLKEFVVFSNNEPIFFRGDTLVMVADSFKTAANANVEDLFKKLPGFDVDNSGKIVVHGQEVSKVYVDGDEFFGTDPTIATKNLPAGAIENVEVYDQKVEGDNTEETEKVINLKLKDNAKRGSFGKLNGASDFQNFYEGEALINRFNGDQKISVFGLFTNTPRSDFNGRDKYQYGLTEEIGNWNDEGSYIYEPQIGNLGEGLPQKSKTGFYYTDKLGEKVTFGTNFTYDNQQVLSAKESYTQYNLDDTTYYNYKFDTTYQEQEAMVLNFKLDWQIDSLTQLEILPRVKQITNYSDENSISQFYTEELFESRKTTNSYEENNIYQEGRVAAKLNRNFKKKFRNLKINYQVKSQVNSSKDYLTTTDELSLFPSLSSVIDQSKNGKSRSLQHFAEAIYTEPIHKLVKLELAYSYQKSIGTNQKYAFDSDGENYSIINNTYSSDFENATTNQKVGGRFIFNYKIHQIIAGADWNQVNLESVDLLNDTSITKNNGNILPYLKYKIKFSQSKQLTFMFNTGVRNPNINQLQPLPDNRNINNIKLGNIDLVSQLERSLSLNYFSYNPMKGSHLFANIRYTNYDNAYSNALTYDQQGRALNQTVNVQGNELLTSYFGGRIPFYKQKFKFNPNLNYTYSKTNSVINDESGTNISNAIYAGGRLEFGTDTLRFNLGGSYGYTIATAALNPIEQRFNTQKYSAGFEWILPFRLELESDIEYNINGQRSNGFDLNYYLWNASISRKFLPKESLVISLEANDILNQNISNNRNVYNNTITDTKTNIIGRYVLLRAVYKFNVLKSQKAEDDLLQD